MTRFLPTRRVAASLAALVFSMGVTTLTSSPVAAAPAPDTSCPADICIWSGPNFTGTKTVIEVDYLSCTYELNYQSIKLATTGDARYAFGANFASDDCEAGSEGTTYEEIYGAGVAGSPNTEDPSFAFGTAHSLKILRALGHSL